jgi:hypothetical protein|tara:strand:+ start:1653 stop:1874 length:222 start_codon:yes stop_codon:yes gene_type:complete
MNIKLQQKINRRKSLIANLPFDSEGVSFDNPSMTVEQGMARAKRLALKGFENSFNESLIRSPFIDSVKSIEVS